MYLCLQNNLGFRVNDWAAGRIGLFRNFSVKQLPVGWQRESATPNIGAAASTSAALAIAVPAKRQRNITLRQLQELSEWIHSNREALSRKGMLCSFC
jgi:hypothetical protein